MKDIIYTDFELEHFFELTPDLVCIAGKDGFFRRVNQSVVDKLGYTQAELFASPIGSFVHPDDKEMTRESRQKLLDGELLLNFANRYVTKAGNSIWLEWTSIYFADKEIVFAIAKDISKRKAIEIEIEQKYHKFKSLATHFKKSIEEDRKFLAYELHEELAQLASAVKLQLEMIPLTVPGVPEPALEKIEHTSALADLLVKTIQRICFSISPAMLDEFGLHATLEWLCKEFAVLNGIPCKLSGIYEEANLSGEIKTDFFRVCQEALNNIMYHAHASGVSITLNDVGNTTVLCIKDDGKGFNVNQEKPSVGLQSMRELAASINGVLTIKSEIGKGTEVCMVITK